jgi:hypothetical protein
MNRFKMSNRKREVLLELHPGVGVNQIFLGMTVEEVLAVLGPPEPTSSDGGPGDDVASDRYHYFGDSLHLMFSPHRAANSNSKLSAIMVFLPVEVLLWGEKFLGVNKKRLNTLISMNCPDAQLYSRFDEERLAYDEMLYVREPAMSFALEDDVVTMVFLYSGTDIFDVMPGIADSLVGR